MAWHTQGPTQCGDYAHSMKRKRTHIVTGIPGWFFHLCWRNHGSRNYHYHDQFVVNYTESIPGENGCEIYSKNLFAVLRKRREEFAHVLRNAKFRGTAKCAHEVYAKREFTRNVVRAHNAHVITCTQALRAIAIVVPVVAV